MYFNDIMNTYFSIMLFVSKLKLLWGSVRGIAGLTSSSRVKWFGGSVRGDAKCSSGKTLKDVILDIKLLQF